LDNDRVDAWRKGTTVRANMKSYFFLAALPLALVACDGGDDTGDDAPALRTVTARDAIELRAADGSVQVVGTDLDRAIVQAVARDATGAWQVYPGMGTSAGEIEIPGVPTGDALVRVDYEGSGPEPQPKNEYFWVRGDADVALDLGIWRTGRTDWQRAETSPTDLGLDLGGLAAWQEGLDLLVVYVPNLDFVNVFDSDIPDSVSGFPATGATSADVHIDWVNAVAGPLVRDDKGDRATLMQFRFAEKGGTYVGTAVRAAALAPFSLTDGAATTVDATLAQTGALTARLAVDRDAFDALRPAVSPQASAAVARGFEVRSSPSDVAVEYSPASLAAELVVIDEGGLDGTGLWDLGDVTLANAFGPETVLTRTVSIYGAPLPRDDGFVANGYVEIGTITPGVPAAGRPAAPIIGPVTGITINGVDAFTAPTNVGTTLTIAWQPPALGTPIAYDVRLVGPGGADPSYEYGWYDAATFHVPGDVTSLELPPELVQDDRPYAIVIRAITSSASTDAFLAAPRHVALPYGWAESITPPFYPKAP
jgi:hypothetical protein